MDFITGFPKVRDFKFVFVVVDRFSKYVVFIPAPDACPAEEAARLFFSNVVKHFGLPRDIVSDRDTRFTGNDATHGSLALKAYQQNLYLKYYY